MTGTAGIKWSLNKETSWPVEEGRYYIANAQDENKILSIRNGNAEVGAYAGLESQLFNIKRTNEDGYYTIQSVVSGKVLDVSGGSSKAKTNLWEYAANNSVSQMWKFIRISDNCYYIKSKLGTVIDIANGTTKLRTNIWMYDPNQSVAQQWRLISSDNLPEQQPLENGTYTIRNTAGSKYALDVTGGTEADKSKMQMFSSNNSPAQHFELYYVGDGYYRI